MTIINTADPKNSWLIFFLKWHANHFARLVTVMDTISLLGCTRCITNYISALGISEQLYSLNIFKNFGLAVFTE